MRRLRVPVIRRPVVELPDAALLLRPVLRLRSRFQLRLERALELFLRVLFLQSRSRFRAQRRGPVRVLWARARCEIGLVCSRRFRFDAQQRVLRVLLVSLLPLRVFLDLSHLDLHVLLVLLAVLVVPLRGRVFLHEAFAKDAPVILLLRADRVLLPLDVRHRDRRLAYRVGAAVGGIYSRAHPPRARVTLRVDDRAQT